MTICAIRDKLRAYRIDLGLFPTRIVEHADLGRDLGVTLYIKNEFEADGFASGNKVRKLEVLLHHAILQRSTDLICAGTIRSNCVMALSHYAIPRGFNVHCLLFGSMNARGNHTQIRLAGAHATYAPRWDNREVTKFMNEKAAIVRSHGGRPYLVPAGATDGVTLLGSMSLALEIAEAEDQIGRRFDVVVCPMGTGGTAFGIECGRQLLGRQWLTIGVSVANHAAFFRAEFDRCIQTSPLYTLLADHAAPCRLHFHDGALFDGYGPISSEHFRHLKRIRRRYGVVLDSVYTYKAFFGLQQLIASGEIGKGASVLFIHTGGITEGFDPPDANFD